MYASPALSVRCPLLSASGAGGSDGNAMKMNRLLDSNADIDSACGHDMAALHMASEKGHIACVDSLLERRAIVNVQSAYYVLLGARTENNR